MHRAYSFLHVKAVDTEQRVIRGTATTPAPDRMGDVVEPLGVTFKNPLPLLLYHDTHKPVGWVKFDKPTKDGIGFEAKLPTVQEAGTVRDRIEEAWTSIKTGLLAGVSIGFRSLEHAFMKETQGIRFLKSEVLELSLVAIPAHPDARIELVKALDIGRPGAPATGLPKSSSTPGVTGSHRTLTMNVSASEQIVEQRALLQTKSARLEELMTAEENEGGLQAEETTERDTLTAELKSITAKLGHLSALEAAQAAQATTVTMPTTRMATPTRTRVEFPKKEYPKGTLFTRYALAVAAGKGSYSDTLAYAKRFSDTPEVSSFVKSMWERKAVEGTSVVSSPGWGGELVNPNTAATEFVELLMPATIIGQVQGFRRVPFNIPVITQTGGSTFDWVVEGGLKPVGELAFTRTTTPHTKCAGIVVLTEELVRLSSPSAEALARQDMIDQCRKFLDEQFIRVGVSAGPGNPASITNGVTSPASTGSDLDSLRADLMTAFSTFTSNSIPITGLVIVMTPELALGISMLTDALGQTPRGFSVTPTGGTLMGYQVVVSESVDSGTIVIFKPSEILLADDGEVRLDSSNQATLDMNTGSPTSPTFNLWQRNCVGLRAERWINWQKTRDNIVAVIDTASYGPSVGSP